MISGAWEAPTEFVRQPALQIAPRAQDCPVRRANFPGLTPIFSVPHLGEINPATDALQRPRGGNSHQEAPCSSATAAARLLRRT